MFTGIVEEVGSVVSVQPAGHGVELRIAARAVLEGMALGDSVAHDGVCLTATSIADESYTVQAVATTLERTTLGELQPGRRVNLERAMALGARLGGHMVAGHVDAVGRVVSIRPREELTLIDFTVPAEIAAVTVQHGSITLNGISLTVNDLPAPGVVQVSIIPYTRQHTNLLDLRVGDGVNLEGDMIGKFVRHMLGAPSAGGAPGGPAGDLMRGWGY
ncbi:MAG: Lumazine-binding domain protein [Gemmatimonadetes bacterium]|nr:Lumazine-binding domain protein [Gemmatimonadota bacterium]